MSRGLFFTRLGKSKFSLAPSGLIMTNQKDANCFWLYASLVLLPANQRLLPYYLIIVMPHHALWPSAVPCCHSWWM